MSFGPPPPIVIVSSESVTDAVATGVAASFGTTESSPSSVTTNTVKDTTTIKTATTAITTTAKTITTIIAANKSSSSLLITATSIMAHSSTGSSPTSYATTISAANNSSNSGAGQLSNGIIGAIAIGATLAAALILFVAWLCVIRCINHRKHAVGDRKIEARGEEIALDSRNTGGGGGRKSYVFKGMGEMYAQTMRAGVERVVTVTRRMTGSTKSGDGVGGRGSGEILGTGGKNGSTRSKESSKLGNSFAYVELEDSAITSGVGGSGSGGGITSGEYRAFS